MKKIFHEVGSEFSIKELNYELEYEKSICSIPYNNNDTVNISLLLVESIKYFV